MLRADCSTFMEFGFNCSTKRLQPMVHPFSSDLGDFCIELWTDGPQLAFQLETTVPIFQFFYEILRPRLEAGTAALAKWKKKVGSLQSLLSIGHDQALLPPLSLPLG